MGDILNEYYAFLESEDGRFFLRQQLGQERIPDSGGEDPLGDAYARAQKEGAPGRVAYLLKALEKMQDGMALRKAPEPGQTREMLAKNLLLGYGKALGCPAFVAGGAWNRKRMAPELAEYLRAHPDAEPEPGLIEALHRELMFCPRRKHTADRVYNYRKRNKRMNVEMKLFAAYLSRFPRSNKSSMTDREIEEAQRLFDALQKEEYKDVMIPVMTLPGSLAGILFVGIDRLLRPAGVVRQRDRNDWCRIVVFYPRKFTHLKQTNSLVSQVTWVDSPQRMNEWYGQFRSVENAVGWLEHNQAEIERLFEPSVRGPEGCPDAYRRYFVTAGRPGPAERDAAARAVGGPAFERDREQNEQERARKEQERQRNTRGRATSR